MKRMSLTAIGSMFTLALCFGSSAMHAERRGEGQQVQQAQQGQGQQGQQGQGQQNQQGGAKPSASPGISLRKFVFTLALGDVQPGAGSTFTPAAAKALADLKDFLPYKRYTLLDTVYKIGLTTPTTQMKGPDDGLQCELWTTGTSLPDGKRMLVKVQLKTVPTRERPLTYLIDTSFEIETGETVVVGTSRLDGNRALLLLVTSVP
jgi:hypothetical protein